MGQETEMEDAKAHLERLSASSGISPEKIVELAQDILEEQHRAQCENEGEEDCLDANTELLERAAGYKEF
jgi:hypothetical protein